MNDVPNINDFGAAKRPNSKKIRGLRGSEGGESNLADYPELVYVYGFSFASYQGDLLETFRGFRALQMAVLISSCWCCLSVFYQCCDDCRSRDGMHEGLIIACVQA